MAFVYGITFILAGCSLLYELLIAQAIAGFVTNNVVWYCLTIGFYLASMGVGAYWCRRIFPRDGEENWLALYKTEMALCVAGGASVISLQALYSVFAFIWGRSLYFPMVKQAIVQAGGTLMFLFWALIIIIVIGILTGLELPLLIRIGNAASPGKPVTNRILAADYFGSLAAGVIFPLWLLPHFDVFTVSLFTALLNFFIVLLIFLGKRKQKPLVGVLGIGIIFAILSLGLYYRAGIEQFFLKKYYYYDYSKKFTDIWRKTDFPDVESFRTPYQKADIVRRPTYPSPMTEALLKAYSAKYRKDPQFPRGYELYLDGNFQFSSDIEEYYHEYFAHIPVILAHHVPKRVLVMGAGDGLLIRELLKYPQIEEIIHVELDPKMVELSKRHLVLRYMNRGAIDDPRVRTVIADAYHFIRSDKDFYDAIYMDFPDATEYMIGKLYSREFYRFVYKRLKDEGFVVFDATGLNAYVFESIVSNVQVDPDETFEIYNNTLLAAGFQTIIPYSINPEQDNPEARKAVADKIEEVVREGKDSVFIESYRFMLEMKGKDFIVDKMIQSFTISLSQGFIMARKASFPANRQYSDYGIELYVLNEKRFKLAFALDDVYSKGKNKSSINSVMRPTLPDASSAFILKRAY